MNADFDQARVELDCALFLRLANARNTTVICLEGCLWVTRDGSAKDVQLTPGESYRLEDAAPVLVTGFGPSLARVMQPAATRRHWAQRWLGALAPDWSRGLAAA